MSRTPQEVNSLRSRRRPQAEGGESRPSIAEMRRQIKNLRSYERQIDDETKDIEMINKGLDLTVTAAIASALREIHL